MKFDSESVQWFADVIEHAEHDDALLAVTFLHNRQLTKEALKIAAATLRAVENAPHPMGKHRSEA